MQEGQCRRGLTPDMLNQGGALLQQQFYALFVKRVLHTRRNKAGAFTQLFWPALFTLFGLIAAIIIPQPGDSPARVLDTSHYGTNIVPFASMNDRTNLYASYFKQQFENPTETENLTGKFNLDGLPYDIAFGSKIRNDTKDGGQSNIAVYNKRHLVAAVFSEDRRRRDYHWLLQQQRLPFGC